MRRHVSLLIASLITVLLFGGLVGAWSTHRRALQSAHVKQTRTATLLLAGDGGNWLSLRSMTLTLNQDHVATHVLTAHVAQNGRVTWQHFAPVKTNNPLIPVLFKNNTNPAVEARQLRTVVSQLVQKEHITSINLIGHSSGGTIAVDYLNDAHRLPVSVQHLVCIGADFPGITPLQRQYPQLHVLNLVGTIGAVANDGEVPVRDAQRLKPLVTHHVASYQYRQVNGPVWQAEHSLLHESAQVDRLLMNFLYAPS